MANLINDELSNLLIEKQRLVQNPIAAAHDYPNLKAQTIQQELRDEIEALTQLLLLSKSLESFRHVFLDRCKRRSERNAGTCLSLFVMPNGECNQLYWQIAEHLFGPKTMGDMLGLLVPNITTLVTYEVFDANEDSLRERVKNPVFHFAEKGLASLDQKPSSNALVELAVSGNQLFEVANLVEFNFATHEKFFYSFTQQYPRLSEALYQHNEAFKKLRQNLLTVSKGQSPREVIKEFIQQFLLGGETLTGETYASLDAQKAVTDFFVYLESLSSTLKEALLGLETPSGISLHHVYEHLKAENCVEQAAAYLQEILNNKDNAATLDTRPDLSSEQLQRIHKFYGKSHALSSVSGSPTALPLHYLKKNLEELVIEDMYVLLDLLLAFPPSYYSLLFKYAQISYDTSSLGEVIESGLFLSEQLTAINQAIVNNMEKFGGFSTCLQFALRHKNDELLKLILSLLAQEEQPAVFLIKQLGGFSASLQMAIAHKNYELLKLILTSLPLEERLPALIQAKISDGHPILDFATVKMPSQFHWILELLPEKHRLTAITEKRPTVLYLIGDDPETLHTTLSLLPEEKRLTALTATQGGGKSGLMRLSFHPRALEAVLKLLPPIDRLSAVTARMFDDQNSLERISFREYFVAILSLLSDIVPPANAAHTTEQNEQIATLYEHIQQLKNHGLELYNQVDDRDAETAGKKAICLAISLANFANHFISAQTDAERQTAQRNFLEELQQNILLQEQALLQPILTNIAMAVFAYTPILSDELGTIAGKLFNKEQLAKLNQVIVKNIEQLSGFSASLQFAISHKNYNLLKLILSSLPLKERLPALLKAKITDDWSILDFASTQMPEDFSLILDLLPENDRLAAIMEGRPTVLYLNGNNPEALRTTLTLLPEAERIIALRAKDDVGRNGLLGVSSHPTALQIMLTLLPPIHRLDAITEDLLGINGQNTLRQIIIRRDFEAVLNLLPEVVIPTNTAYSVKKNAQISMLYNNINQLKSYGLKLYNQPNDWRAEKEGKKAICLAISLSHFANRFINAQSNEARQIAQKTFQEKLQQGMLDMRHRALWKPVLANIAIAATGLGLLVIVGKLLLTESAFFMQTERHKQIDKIAMNFTDLLIDEACLANSTTDEIASHLNTDLSPSA